MRRSAWFSGSIVARECRDKCLRRLVPAPQRPALRAARRSGFCSTRLEVSSAHVETLEHHAASSSWLNSAVDEMMFSLGSLRAHCQINRGSLRLLRNLSQLGMALETLYLGPIRVRSSESPNGQARLASLVRHLKWRRPVRQFMVSRVPLSAAFTVPKAFEAGDGS